VLLSSDKHNTIKPILCLLDQDNLEILKHCEHEMYSRQWTMSSIMFIQQIGKGCPKSWMPGHPGKFCTVARNIFSRIIAVFVFIT
jgi:hypothetical protein